MFAYSLTFNILIYTSVSYIDAQTSGQYRITDDYLYAGYYWRNYINGVLPYDSLPGGRNSAGYGTYIGQVLHNEQLIPAKIDSQTKEVTFEWGYTEYKHSGHVKVLCARYPEQFIWISTNFTHFGLLSNYHLVPGGYEANTGLYIGRKELQNELAVGKVVSTNIQTTLNTSNRGKVEQHGQFDVLAYFYNIKPTGYTGSKVGSTNTEKNSENLGCKAIPVTINFFTDI